MATYKKVSKYALSWNPKTNKGGAVALKFDDGSTATLPVESMDEFLVLAAVLNQSPVYVRDDGLIVGEDSP